jgi:hypothetical protein
LVLSNGTFGLNPAAPVIRSRMEDYAATPAGALRGRNRDQDGAQPGDPVPAVEAIMSLVRAGSAPLRLPLGRSAVQRIRAKLQGQLADLETYAELALATDRSGAQER